MTPISKPDQVQLPPIPDGGLAEFMPDWMKDEPDWSTPASLAEPDRSPIDPRELLEEADLPEWLRLVAQRTHVVEEVAEEITLRPATLEDFAPELPQLIDEREIATDKVSEETEPEIPVAEVVAPGIDEDQVRVDKAPDQPEPDVPVAQAVAPVESAAPIAEPARSRDPILIGLIAAAVVVTVVLVYALVNVL